MIGSPALSSLLGMRTVIPRLGLSLALAALAWSTSARAASTCYQLPFPNPNLADGWGSTCCGRTSPHRGVDFPQPSGKPIPAVADGVVRRNEYTGCLGHALVLEHPDGMFSGYSHMVTASPLPIGTVVKKGDIIGKVGNTGTCSKGAHLHLTMSPGVDGFKSGTTVDPYKYIQAHLTCEPPSCDRSADGFTFSCDGPADGQTCVNVDEPDDSSTWADNFFCHKRDLGMTWSHQGTVDGMVCTSVHENASPAAASWKDDFLCLPPQSPYAFAFSASGPIQGQACIQWNEPAATSWNDNFVCVKHVSDFAAGDFHFSADGPEPGLTCVKVDEPGDPDTWTDNHFCSTTDLGMKWSSQGPIDGMVCTNVTEGAEAKPQVWADNFLCLPEGAPYTFTWSSAGPIDGQTCIRWFDHAETSTSWWDNWLCVEPVAPAPGPGAGGAAGASGSSGGSAVSGTAGAAGKPASGGAAGQGSASAGGSTAGGKAGQKASAGGGRTGTPGSVELAVDESESESGGCSQTPGQRAGLLGVFGALAALLAMRRRR